MQTKEYSKTYFDLQYSLLAKVSEFSTRPPRYMAKPQNWNEVYAKWKQGEITAVKAMELTGLTKTTFYKLAKEQ